MFRALLAIALLAVLPVQAQEWPVKPVRMIVPFPPGGGTDTVARPLAAKLTQILGQQVLIDNRGGAGGTIGAGLAAKAPADGYTVLLYSVHGAVAAAAYKTLPYDLQKDLVPVTTAAIFPDVLLAANRVPAKTLSELITWAKANPGKLNCGSAGNGTSRHLSCELFNTAAGISATHVPYKGTGPATQALVAGEIDWVFEALGSAAGQIRAGTVRPIVVTSAKRSPAFPEIPTAMESGLAGFEVTSWYGLWVPVGTPAAIVQKLNEAVVKAFADPELKDTWAKLGAEPGGSSPEAFRALVEKDVAKWGKVVRDAKVVLE
ncbi:MAG TPA: tripartite tricarboxylate transporter substrate binding protein [Caldimonas sp.]|jgi:tripartite-type tricarboxylate transporter receptor subunit TctC|nr:tripartite tricarboxylate transporter substrate binding protein [Caldimonas sp.]HEX2541434.1 tripartite tricarboxylate transporter substrate binding protein [Caldimonas sp.]